MKTENSLFLHLFDDIFCIWEEDMTNTRSFWTWKKNFCCNLISNFQKKSSIYTKILFLEDLWENLYCGTLYMFQCILIEKCKYIFSFIHQRGMHTPFCFEEQCKTRCVIIREKEITIYFEMPQISVEKRSFEGKKKTNWSAQGVNYFKLLFSFELNFCYYSIVFHLLEQQEYSYYF